MLKSQCIDKTNCLCCQVSNQRISELQRNSNREKDILNETVANMLQELNSYRRLLHLEPLKNASAFEDIKHFQADNSPPSNLAPLNLASLPREILDKIVRFIDSQSILPLCHAIKRLKPISEAIHDVQKTFKSHISDVWPDFYFPRDSSSTNYATPLEIQLHDMFKVFRLSTFLTKYNRCAIVLPGTPSHMTNISTLLPSRIIIHSPTDVAEYSYPHRLDLFLKSLTLIKPKPPIIQQFEFPSQFDGSSTPNGLILQTITEYLSKLFIEELSFFGNIPLQIARNLHRIKGLSIVAVEDAGLDFPVWILKKCTRLRKLVFEFPNFSISKLQTLVAALPFALGLEEIHFRFMDSCKDELTQISRTCLDRIGWSVEVGVYQETQFLVWIKKKVKK
ncbi:hypothetical protein BDR26DRAFT_924240 [Obelidium mucronatum]|nr:hypothetical protein BDR26DRAFT_924240 [Obelidium mucronatum]